MTLHYPPMPVTFQAMTRQLVQIIGHLEARTIKSVAIPGLDVLVRLLVLVTTPLTFDAGAPAGNYTSDLMLVRLLVTTPLT